MYPSCVTPGSRISLELHPPVAYVALNHPPVNVIDIPMMEELAAAIAQIEARPDVSVIVLRGSATTFSAGVDVAAHVPETVREMLAKFHAIFLSLVNSRKVWVALVRGNCLGGGAELAMVCDIVLTAESATWAFPEIQLGCFPPVAATALAALVGQKRAAELILTGRRFDGRQAHDWGLANVAAVGTELDSQLEELLRRLGILSPAALAVTKKAIYAWNAMHFDKGLARAEKIYNEELMQTEDAREGIEAFLERREPHWRGR